MLNSFNQGNLNIYSRPFSFLVKETKKPAADDCCGWAWCYANFHLEGNNYYLYACHHGEKQVKKGILPKECLTWGGQDVEV